MQMIQKAPGNVPELFTINVKLNNFTFSQRFLY